MVQSVKMKSVGHKLKHENSSLSDMSSFELYI